MASSTVGATQWVPCVAVTAYHHFLVVLLGKSDKGWFHFTTTQAEHQVDCRLFLDVVVSECAVVLQLLTSKDETLLIRRDGLFILDFCFQGIDSLCRLHVKSDVLAR